MVDTAEPAAATASAAEAASAAAPLPDRSVVPAVWSRITNLIVERGEGSWLVTRDGERYLDYSSGIGVTNTGHAHPRVAAAIADQASRLIHGQQNIVFHEPGLRLYDRLAGLLPGGPWQAFLSNSGAEAVEAAVKLARVATGRPSVVAFRGGFHGRTAQAMALTSAKDVYRVAFEPLPGSVYHTPFPYCYRAPGGAHDPAACTCSWEADLELLFHQLVDPARVAAVIVEPVLGEGGYVVPPPTFLPRLREITRRHGILLVADEIQTGYGRTGRVFAIEHSGVEPDILVMAKGIASGLPLSGILARRELVERWTPGSHGGTYGGNVVACAAALATLDVIRDEDLVANAAARGAQFLAGLREFAAGHDVIGDVRGLGLMLALEFVRPREGDGRVPDAALTKRVIAEALERRLIVLSAGTFANVVRIIPPLVTTTEEVGLALGILEESLAAAVA
ncbi:MAG TPA: aminotransferase class III-fold pyridoxal phosphate-dependent enzyme [Candidatus Limnocylindrales bacterium]|nr:aminotransferase class III-fold pyridoxal phosphate-dependent enzyme [Candidatus Limnocylindrales bacterium]